MREFLPAGFSSRAELSRYQRILFSEIEWILSCPSLLRWDLAGAGMPVLHPGWQSFLWKRLSRERLLVRHFLVAFEELYPKREDSRRLGRWYETLMALCFGSLYGEGMFHGVQIQNQRQTIGELDFLLKTPEGHWLHIEVGLKFYIYGAGAGERARLSDYRGARGIDRLDTKFDMLARRQLTLPQKSPAIRSLANLGVDAGVLASFAWLQGCLFYPVCGVPEFLPALMEPGHLQGKWLRLKHLLNLLNDRDQNQLWVVSGRRDWMVLEHPLENTVQTEELPVRLREGLDLTGGVVLLRSCRNLRDGWVREDERFLIVDSGQYKLWPDEREPAKEP